MEPLHKGSKIKLKVKTGKSKTEIDRIEKEIYYINVKAQPIENKANLEIIKFFKKHFKTQVKIIKGLKSKEKILEII